MTIWEPTKLYASKILRRRVISYQNLKVSVLMYACWLVCTPLHARLDDKFIDYIASIITRRGSVWWYIFVIEWVGVISDFRTCKLSKLIKLVICWFYTFQQYYGSYLNALNHVHCIIARIHFPMSYVKFRHISWVYLALVLSVNVRCELALWWYNLFKHISCTLFPPLHLRRQ